VVIDQEGHHDLREIGLDLVTEMDTVGVLHVELLEILVIRVGLLLNTSLNLGLLEQDLLLVVEEVAMVEAMGLAQHVKNKNPLKFC
jgi:hypothetical protein